MNPQAGHPSLRCQACFAGQTRPGGPPGWRVRKVRNSQRLLRWRAEGRIRHFTYATPNRSGFEFTKVMFELALQYPKAKTIHLVVDNLNIHRRKSLTDVLGEEVGAEVWNRFTVHYTPKHGSWFNQAEIAIGIFSRQCLGKCRIPDLKTLRQQVRPWNRAINRAGTKIEWRFDRKSARRKVGYEPKRSTRSEN